MARNRDFTKRKFESPTYADKEQVEKLCVRIEKLEEDKRELAELVLLFFKNRTDTHPNDMNISERLRKLMDPRH